MRTVFHHRFLSETAVPTGTSEHPKPALIAGWTLVALMLAVAPSARADGNWLPGVAYDAIILGVDVDGTPLEPCLASQPGYPGEHPGKKPPAASWCSFGYGGREVFATTYTTLRPTWTRARESGMSFGQEANGTPQAFCRGPYAGGLQVGKKVAGDDGCYVSYGGQEVRLTDYEVLSEGSSFALRAAPQQALNDIAIVAGYEADSRPLYACIASFGGGTHLGKTRRDWTDCMISYGGGERAVRTFQVVVPYVAAGGDTATLPMLRAGSEPSQALGVCVGGVRGSRQVGKYLFNSGTCNVSFGGSEVPVSDFVVLRGSTGVHKRDQDRGTPTNKTDQGKADPNQQPGVGKNPNKNDPWQNPTTPTNKSDQGKADPSQQPGVSKNPNKIPTTPSKGNQKG